MKRWTSQTLLVDAAYEAYESSETREPGATEDEAAFRLLFDGHPQPMWIYDPESLAFMAVNDAALQSYGYSRDEFLTMTLDDVRAPEGGPVQKVPRGAGLVPFQPSLHRRKDGTRIHVEVAAHDITLGGRHGRLVLSAEVTQRRRAEQALLESERRFRHLLEHVRLFAVMLDGCGRVTFCNDYLLSVTGHQRDDLVGKDFFDACVPADRRDELRRGFLDKIASGVVLPRDESEIVTANGERRLISFTNTVLRDVEGMVVGTASIGRDVTEERRAEEQLAHDALHDALTGLPNRALFLERLEGAVARARRRDDYLYAVLFVDLDRFKVLNESLGHRAGDDLLLKAARVLEACVRPEDTVARLGGDEFTILLDDIGDIMDATRVATRIHDTLAAPFDIQGSEVYTTASIGIAVSSRGAALSYERPEDVLRDADTAMYRAKARGKARHEIFDASMHRRAVSQLELETDLRRALDRGELRVEYQPIVSLKTGAVTGFEALARWRHPRRGEVSPAEFIPVSEETGLILSLGRWVLQRACEEMRRFGSLTMSVNLSVKQLAHPGLFEDIDRTLADTGVDPRRLKLELTESALMENPEHAAELLAALKTRGIAISIDDFGTGYSSLSYLLKFPIDALKIDRAFVRGMGDGEGGAQNLELVRAIVTLARNLDLDVVAEGVETAAQKIRLEALGCQLAQGFLFSPAVSADVALRFAEQHPKS